MIRINVGGTIFCSSKDTLQKMDYFKASLSEKWLKSETPIFIDRDPSSFSKLLTHVRGYSFILEQYNEVELFHLKEDADFFGVETLKKIIEDHLQKEDGPFFIDSKKWVKLDVRRGENLEIKCKTKDLFKDKIKHYGKSDDDSRVTIYAGDTKMKYFRSRLWKWLPILDASHQAKSLYIDIDPKLFREIYNAINDNEYVKNLDQSEINRWNDIFRQYGVDQQFYVMW